MGDAQNTVGKYEDKIIEQNLDDIAKGEDEEIMCACKEIVDEGFIERFKDKVHKRRVDVDSRIKILCRNNAGTHFLKNVETFKNLKENLNKVREKVTTIDSSYGEVDRSITKSTENVIELKEQFERVLETMQVMKGLKKCFEYLEKAEIFVERGNLPQGEELLGKLKDTLDKISDSITNSVEEFLRSKIRKLESKIRINLEMQLSDWIDNLQKEQTRIGEQVRNFAEDRLIRNMTTTTHNSLFSKGSFRDTYKESFKCLGNLASKAQDENKLSLVKMSLKQLRERNSSFAS